MKQFAWRMQRVLDIRAIEEQTKRAQLLKLTEELAQRRGELLMQKRVLERLISEISSRNARDRLGEQEFFLKCSAINDERIKELKRQIRELELKQKEKIAEVLKARRLKEGMERLRTEARKKFIEEQERLEQKELDEVATIGFGRKRTTNEAEAVNVQELAIESGWK